MRASHTASVATSANAQAFTNIPASEEVVTVLLSASASVGVGVVGGNKAHKKGPAMAHIRQGV